MRRYVAAAVMGGLVLAGSPVEAKPKGFFAKHFIKPVFGKKAAEQADRLHAQAGKPLDRAAQQAVEQGIKVILK